jgi:PadR family transcriptional regulator, regulatory protein PadR
MSRPVDLVQGTLDVLILSIVAAEPLHGLAISQRLLVKSADVLQVSQGSLYPALHKLEQQGLLRAEWRSSESGKRAKYYSLTKAGARRLREELAEWERLSAAISLVLRPT